MVATTTMDLVPSKMNGHSIQHATPFEPEGLEQAYALAQRLSKSGLIPDPLKGKPDDVLVVLMTGRELGLQPMQALRLLAVVKGKAVMGADLLVGLVLSKPEVCEFFRVVESTDAKAVYQTKRRGSEPVTLSFTLEQAKQAGLTGKDNWRNYPAAMLRARCAAALARAVYPDLCAGVYETDEADDLRRGTSRPSPVPHVTSAPPEPTATVIDLVPSATSSTGPAFEAPADAAQLPLIERLLVGLEECQSRTDLERWLEAKNAHQTKNELTADDLGKLKSAYAEKTKSMRAGGAL